MSKIKLLLAGILLAGGLVAVASTVDVAAVNVFDRSCSGANVSTALCADRSDNAQSMVGPIVSTLLFVVGIVSVIVIIIGGIMYITSAGDPGRAKKAKDTIMYAVIGLVVAIMAYAIVDFVIRRL